MNRRELLQYLGAVPGLALAPRALAGPVPRLRAAPATLALAGQPQLGVWAYGAQVPGPVLRRRRGEVLELELENGLPDATTIHWHGVRVPQSMDGVPHLTQAPVAPGDRFRYRFAPPDAGTYWYHPHLGTPEQVGRGLYGALIVEDDEPPPVDADRVWMLDDWRLDAQGRIDPDFYNLHDVAHAGRLGQQLTVNGQAQWVEPLRAGQRLRLRLVNAANARIFALELRGLKGWLIARDGVPAEAAVPWEGPLLLGPGMRTDFIVDADTPGRHALVALDRRGEVALGTFEVTGAAPASRRAAPVPARHQPLPEPVLSGAATHEAVIGGGMMSRSGWPEEFVTGREARRKRREAGSREADPVWTINGRAQMGHGPGEASLFTAAAGSSVRLIWDNRTAWWHPMHLHGHHFRVLARNGEALAHRPWRDTVLLAPGDRVEIAFVADNPGRWLIHCHALEHHAGGMGAVFEVA